MGRGRGRSGEGRPATECSRVAHCTQTVRTPPVAWRTPLSRRALRASALCGQTRTLSTSLRQRRPVPRALLVEATFTISQLTKFQNVILYLSLDCLNRNWSNHMHYCMLYSYIYIYIFFNAIEFGDFLFFVYFLNTVQNIDWNYSFSIKIQHLCMSLIYSLILKLKYYFIQGWDGSYFLDPVRIRIFPRIRIPYIIGSNIKRFGL